MKLRNNTLTKVWAQWISSQEFRWNIFLTIHYYNKTSSNSAINVINRIRKFNSGMIQRIFYINEREKDMRGVHSHILIETNEPHLLMDNLSHLNSFSHPHFELLEGNDAEYDKDGVGWYITKFIDRQHIDYDFL